MYKHVDGPIKIWYFLNTRTCVLCFRVHISNLCETCVRNIEGRTWLYSSSEYYWSWDITLSLLLFFLFAWLPHIVHHDQKEKHIAKQIICERSFVGTRDSRKRSFIGRIDLHTQGYGQNKYADGRQEAGEKRIERERSDHRAVDELHNSRHHDIGKKAVNEFHLLGCVLFILAPYVELDSIYITTLKSSSTLSCFATFDLIRHAFARPTCGSTNVFPEVSCLRGLCLYRKHEL